MSIAGLLDKFDKGVEKAWRAYLEHGGDPEYTFGEKIASFSFYDIDAVNQTGKGMWKPLDDKIEKEPILWREIHQPLALILREDQDIAKYYAGFATLFTVDRNERVYPSMAVDVPLDARGFKNLELSNWQFRRKDPDKPLVLTDVVLNKSGDPKKKFNPEPIIFYWRSSESNSKRESKWALAPKGLQSWAHIFVTAKIPTDSITGLTTDGFDWDEDFSEMIVVPNVIEHEAEVLSDASVYERLAKAAAKASEDSGVTLGVTNDSLCRKRLRNRLAWTLTYFAYGCRTFCEMHKDKAFDHLAIICIPSSSDGEVSSALYVPVHCHPADPEFASVAVRILHLARSLGMPLKRIYDLTAAKEKGEVEGTTEAMRQFAHQIKSIGSKVDRWLVSPDRWDEITKKFASAPSVSSRVHRDSYKIAPAPELHQALGRTLVLWSLTYNPTDLFPNTKGAPPSSLAMLAMAAWDLAKDACFVHECAPKSFENSNDNLWAAWTHDRWHQKKIITDSVAGWMIDLSCFEATDKSFKVEHRNAEHWKQLSGLLRIFVVVCENFLGCVEAGEKLSIMLELKDGWLRLACSNKRLQNNEPRADRNHMGFTGLGLIEYLCREFLKTDAEKIVEKTRDTYSLVIRMRQPHWLKDK